MARRPDCAESNDPPKDAAKKICGRLNLLLGKNFSKAIFQHKLAPFGVPPIFCNKAFQP